MSAPVLLITSVGAPSGEAVLSTIRKRWGNDVYLVGTHHLPAAIVPAGRWLDRYVMLPQDLPPMTEWRTSIDHQSPFIPLFEAVEVDPELPAIDRADLVAHLAAEVAAHVVLPLADDDVAAVATYDLSPSHTNAPDPALVEQLHDRLALADLVESVADEPEHLRCPFTESLERASWNRRGLRVRRRSVPPAPPPEGSVAGDGITLTGPPRNAAGRTLVHESSFEHHRTLHRPGGPAFEEPLVVQPCLDGPEVIADIWRPPAEATTVVVFRERVHPDADTWRVFLDPLLEAELVRLLDRLGVTGLLCARFRPSRVGRLTLIDLLLRPSNDIALTQAAGFDLIGMAVADVLGWPVPDCDPSTEGIDPPFSLPLLVARSPTAVTLG